MPSTGEAKRRQNMRNNRINNGKRDAKRSLLHAYLTLYNVHSELNETAPVFMLRCVLADAFIQLLPLEIEQQFTEEELMFLHAQSRAPPNQGRVQELVHHAAPRADGLSLSMSGPYHAGVHSLGVPHEPAKYALQLQRMSRELPCHDSYATSSNEGSTSEQARPSGRATVLAHRVYGPDLPTSASVGACSVLD